MAPTVLDIVIILGLIPAAIFLLLYGLRSPWWETGAGRVIFGLVAAVFGSQAITLISEIFESWSESDTGHWVRATARGILAIALWYLLRMLLRAQNPGPGREDDEDTGAFKRRTHE